MDIFKLVGSIFVDTEEANKSLAKTDEKAQSTGSTLGKIAKGAGKTAAAIGTAAVAVGSAVAVGAKKAVDSYADYEQVVGGVETLFGDSADKVIANAENAYKNAGMTATEYMETVTGFSASLLHGLNGDTEKAAVAADQALTDMADNAAKFGTDIGSIQNAYAGFSKQNYTMLDNLKLGYGGTKAEMERLLKDAKELTGVEYNIDNLSDVYSAIHAIQEEMGVTGTVQAEASTTISGAVDMITNKFDDLKTELGGALAPAFQSVLTLVIDNIPTIQKMVEGLIPVVTDMITNFLPPLLTLAESILPVIFDVVNQLLPVFTEIINAIMPVLIELIQTLAPIFSQLVQLVMPIFVQLIQMIAPILTPIVKLLSPLFTLILQLLEPLLKLINFILPPIIALVTKVADVLIGKLTNSLSKVTSTLAKLKEVVRIVFEQIKSFVKNPVNAVLGFINGMIRGVCGGINGIVRALNRLQVNVPAWVTTLTGVSSFGFHLNEVSAPQIPLLAKGGELSGGAAIVGEDGPELIQTNGRSTRVTPLNDNNNAFTEVSAKIDTLIDLMRESLEKGIYLDSGALVGKLAPAMDKRLGYLATKAVRSV